MAKEGIFENSRKKKKSFNWCPYEIICYGPDMNARATVEALFYRHKIHLNK